MGPPTATQMEFDDVLDFLQRKGSVEILIEIGSGSATFQQLDKTVLVSASTVSNRLQEAVELDFTEITHQLADYGIQKRYKLTKPGTTVLRWAQELDLDHQMRERRRLQRECQTKREILIDRFRKDEHVRDYYVSRLLSSEGPPRPRTDDKQPENAIDPDEVDIEEDRRRNLYRRQLDRDGTDLPEESDE